jgi:hypothetical protein
MKRVPMRTGTREVQGDTINKGLKTQLYIRFSYPINFSVSDSNVNRVFQSAYTDFTRNADLDMNEYPGFETPDRAPYTNSKIGT